MKYTQEFIQKVIELYLTTPVSLIAKQFNLDRSKITYIVCKYGNPRKVGYANELTRKKCDDFYFHVIDTEHKAYWLGFLYADGFVDKNRNRISLALNSNDEHHILKFIFDIKSEKCLKRSKLKCPVSKNNTYASSITITSRLIKEDLIEKGCINKKSLILKFPNKNIFKSPDLIRHFIRGYFDGDGSVFISMEKHWRHGTIVPVIHYRFCGTKDFLTVVQSEINLVGRLTRAKKGHEMFELAYKRRKKLFDFYKYLYKDATIWLERKRNIFENYIIEKCSETIISQLNELKG